jgi:hypothetical protein
VTDAPTAYILLGHTLAELHAQCPAPWNVRHASLGACLRWRRYGFRKRQLPLAGDGHLAAEPNRCNQ